MSKQALSLLAKELGRDALENTWQGSSKDFRQKHLDYKKQYVEDSTYENIESQLRIQFLGYDNKNKTDLYQQIENAKAFGPAAKIYLDTLNASFTADEKKAAAGLKGIVAVVNNYDGLNKRRITPAEKAAKDFLASKINSAELSKMKLLSPDHSFPNAEIRFSRSLYNVVSMKNPDLTSPSDIIDVGKSVINDLARVPFGASNLITEELREYFVESFVKISSRFTGGLSQKQFDLEFGAQLAPRSQFDNEEHGKLVQEYTKNLSKAAKTIAGKTNWAAQESSDDYLTAVIKQLNNSAVKAGAKGKFMKINSQPATAQEKKSFKFVQKVSKVSLGSKTRPPKKAVKQVKPLISLTTIVNYINARLPEAVRANMNSETLVYRTGRFANSAKLVGGQYTPQGFPSLAYTYLRSPYDVFDPVLGRRPWNTPGRDPKALVEKSVRDIARDMAIGRFYLRRA